MTAQFPQQKDSRQEKKGKQKSERSKEIITLKQKLKHASEQVFFPRMIAQGEITEEELPSLFEDLEKQVQGIQRAISTPSMKQFLYRQIEFCLDENAPASMQETLDLAAAYENNDGEKMETMIKNSSHPEEILRKLFAFMHNGVRIEPLPAFLEKRFSIIEEILKKGVSPNFMVPCHRKNNILQALFENPCVTNTLDITEENIEKPLMQFIAVLIDGGLTITNKNAAGQHVLDVIMSAKRSIESQIYEENKGKYAKIQSVFNKIIAVIRDRLEAKQRAWRTPHGFIWSSTPLPSNLADLVCNYLHVNIWPQIECLQSITYDHDNDGTESHENEIND